MPSSIEAQVFDASGTMIQTIGFELKARAWQQKGITAPVDNGLVSVGDQGRVPVSTTFTPWRLTTSPMTAP